MEILKYIFSAHPDKAPLRIMITDNQDGVGGAVADVLREQFSITHDLRIFFTRCAEELTRAARQYSFDFFVLNLEMICFPSKHNFNLSQEYRKTMSLRLIRYLHQRYGIPALVLYCWRGPKFQAVIKNERFAFAIPCSVNALKKAVDCCIKEVVMQNQREQSNRTDPPESHSILVVDADRDVL